jgi:hypothetical protein
MKRRLTAATRPRSAARAAAPTPDAALLAGEIAVLRLPNAARDLDTKTARPRLNVLGGPARVVALAHGGEVLADATVVPGASRIPGFAPPHGTERVAVAIAGATNADAPGLSGWIASTALAYVGWATAIAAGAVVRVENASVTRTRHRRTAGWIRGAEFVDGTSLVITRFVDPVTTVVIALDDPDADGARNLSLGLAGATRAPQADGSPAPPRAVVRANRTFLIYDVVPDGKNAVTVTVASDAGWHLAGVLGGTASADVVASWATGRGLDAMVRPVLPGVGASRTLQWIAVQLPPIDRPGRPKPRIVTRSQFAQPKRPRAQRPARPRAKSSRKRTAVVRKTTRRRRRK